MKMIKIYYDSWWKNGEMKHQISPLSQEDQVIWSCCKLEAPCHCLPQGEPPIHSPDKSCSWHPSWGVPGQNPCCYRDCPPCGPENNLTLYNHEAESKSPISSLDIKKIYTFLGTWVYLSIKAISRLSLPVGNLLVEDPSLEWGRTLPHHSLLDR